MSTRINNESAVSITPLLKRLWPVDESVTAEEIANAISHIFTDSLSPVQTGALLTGLHFTGLDRRSDVLSHCAQAMRDASAQVDKQALRDIIRNRGRREGTYAGGLCDVVGTGGDSHNTFNVSTTVSIVASSLLLVAKHGNRASTSKSGSADLLQNIMPQAPALERITPRTLPQVFEHSNYAFLFAPTFHPGMKYVVPIRKELGWRTIFNLLGPLSNPVDSTSAITHPTSLDSSSLIEARLIGVARKDLGEAFARSFVLSGARKVMVVCGDEDLDEISCAGPTHCWLVRETRSAGDKKSNEVDGEAPLGNAPLIEKFTVSPKDFGFPEHPLETVGPGKGPHENAETLLRILKGELPRDDPIMHFVLINCAALFVVSGVCDGETSAMGPGDHGNVITETGSGGQRWKEGVRRARWAIESGAALEQLHRFVKVTNAL